MAQSRQLDTLGPGDALVEDREPQISRQRTTTVTRLSPYVGGGPNFGLSHRGFETEDGDNVDIDGPDDVDDDDEPSRFDFSDNDFNGGMNFIVGMRQQSGVFFEMKATAWGVSNIRLLAGFNF